MTFTLPTIKKLRALGLAEDLVEKVLEIFEEARQAAKKPSQSAAKAERGTRLPENWELPIAWQDYALGIGLRPQEVAREARRFRDYWIQQPGAKGLKLKWDATWRNWCLSMLERAGRPPRIPDPSGSAPGGQVPPEQFTPQTWKAIADRYRAGSDWKSEWGPPPGRMDCLMPADLL